MKVITNTTAPALTIDEAKDFPYIAFLEDGQWFRVAHTNSGRVRGVAINHEGKITYSSAQIGTNVRALLRILERRELLTVAFPNAEAGLGWEAAGHPLMPTPDGTTPYFGRYVGDTGAGTTCTVEEAAEAAVVLVNHNDTWWRLASLLPHRWSLVGTHHPGSRLVIHEPRVEGTQGEVVDYFIRRGHDVRAFTKHSEAFRFLAEQAKSIGH